MYSNFLFDFSVFCYKGFDDKIERNSLKYVPEAITYPEADVAEKMAVPFSKLILGRNLIY